MLPVFPPSIGTMFAQRGTQPSPEPCTRSRKVQDATEAQYLFQKEKDRRRGPEVECHGNLGCPG